MPEDRNSSATSSDEVEAARSPAAERRVAGGTGWNASAVAMRAVRNHLVAVMAATR